MSCIAGNLDAAEKTSCNGIDGTGKREARREKSRAKSNEISASWGGARANSGGPRPGFGGSQPGAGRPRKRVIEARPLGPRWYVLELASGQENRIVGDLALGESRSGYIPRPEFETFLPQTKTIRIRRGVKRVDVVPMLKGYAFVRLDVRVDEWARLLACEGVRAILSTRGGLPIPVSDRDVARLRAASEQELGLDPLAMPSRCAETLLRVTDGPFTSFDAVCIRCDGITTTARVEIFGRSCEVTLPWAHFADRV